MNIGNCSESTQVYLGEVDFGENGDKYAAAGIVLQTDGMWTVGQYCMPVRIMKVRFRLLKLRLMKPEVTRLFIHLPIRWLIFKGPNHDGVFEGAQTQ